MSNPFAPAIRRRRPMRVAITGPAGSGKTEGALRLARAIVGDQGRIAMIDTENDEGQLYANEPGIGHFDHLPIRAPFLTAKYLKAMDAAVEHGYHALVIDSMTHQWAGEGGILERRDEAGNKPNANKWAAWLPYTAEHNRFIARLAHYELWVFVTLRSKMAYMQEGRGESAKIVKVGMEPITRDGSEYEFSLVFDMDINHQAKAVKGRGSITQYFAGEAIDFRNPRYARAILDWQESAADEEMPPTPEQMQELAQLAQDPRWTPRQAASLLDRGSLARTTDDITALMAAAVKALVKISGGAVTTGEVQTADPAPANVQPPAATSAPVEPSPVVSTPSASPMPDFPVRSARDNVIAAIETVMRVTAGRDSIYPDEVRAWQEGVSRELSSFFGLAIAPEEVTGTAEEIATRVFPEDAPADAQIDALGASPVIDPVQEKLAAKRDERNAVSDQVYAVDPTPAAPEVPIAEPAKADFTLDAPATDPHDSPAKQHFSKNWRNNLGGEPPKPVVGEPMPLKKADA